MHSVGIKRVFWTNAQGQWEGGKVRDLIDVLDGGGAGDGTKGTGSQSGADKADDSSGGGATTNNGSVPGGPGLFVTKHEVLMLRRVMGAEIAAGDSAGPSAAGGGKGRRRGRK